MTELADEHDFVALAFQSPPENALAFRICVVRRGIEQVNAAKEESRSYDWDRPVFVRGTASN
jgi:hypothetical protein